MLILAVSLSACPDEDDPKPSEAKVEGTYRLTFYEFTANYLTQIEGEWVTNNPNEMFRAVDIDMTVTFREDGTFQPEGGYTMQSETGSSYSQRPQHWGEFRWKIEGNKFYVSNDGFLDNQISFNPWTHVFSGSSQEFVTDGLNILGITDSKITLELIGATEPGWEFDGLPRRFTTVGTVVFEK